jgi:hypothetical protein
MRQRGPASGQGKTARGCVRLNFLEFSGAIGRATLCCIQGPRTQIFQEELLNVKHTVPCKSVAELLPNRSCVRL